VTLPPASASLVLFLAAFGHAAPPLENLAVPGGLAVHMGASADGALERRLAATGRWLVLSLTLDRDAEERLADSMARAGLSGLVAVAQWRRLPLLPLADNMADLIVADLDALEEIVPNGCEILRSLVPARGRSLVKHNGEWREIAKPMPGDLDEWTHFFHGPDGNAVSRDRAVEVPNALRWIAGPRQHDWVGADEWRVAGGIAACEWNYPLRVKRVHDAVVVEAREAFNGVLLWRRVVRGGSRSAKTKPLILADGRLFRVDDTEKEWKIAAFDPESGERLIRYENSFTLKASQWGRPVLAPFGLIYHKGRLYQSLGRGLRCIEAASGRLLWELTVPEDQGYLYRPTIAPDLGLVFLLQGPDPQSAKKLRWKGLFGGRYPGPIVEHILAVEAATGRLRWRVRRNPRFLDLPGNKWDGTIGRRKVVFHVVAYHRGRLFLLFACDANGGGPSLVVCHDARTGKELWYTLTRPDYDTSAKKIGGGGEMFNLFALDDGTLLTIGHYWARIDQESGKLLAYGTLGGNARCDTHSCTVNLVTAGFGNFFDLTSPRFRWTRRDITRGQCGGRSTPAYGMTFHQCSGCKCFFAVRGLLALHRARRPKPLPDDQRLVPGPAAGAPLGRPAAEGDWPAYLHDGERRGWTPAPGPKRLDELWQTKVAEPLPPDTTGVRNDWLQTSLYNGPTTAPVVAAGLVFVADRDRGRLVALDAARGKQLWAYRAGGRIITPPTYSRGRVVFGTRRGWVHCLEAPTGRLAWRFMAAPEQRFVVAYGQVESAWPLHGCLPVADGVVVATAGYHGETDGGVWAWGLDLATGAVRWKRRLYRPERPWLHYGPPKKRGIRSVRDLPDPLGYVNRSNGAYCVTEVRNIDLPMNAGTVARVARVLLDARTGDFVATPMQLTASRDERPAVPRFITYAERFPFLDMEFEAPGGPHGTGSWGWDGVAGGRSGCRRLVHNGKAVVLARLAYPAPLLYYLSSAEKWTRDYFRVAKPIASLKGLTDSLVAAAEVAYAAGEGQGKMPWGKSTRPRPRIAKGERVPGHLMAISLPDGKVLDEVTLDWPVINNGLAVAGGRLYAACEDGTVRCFADAGPDAPAR